MTGHLIATARWRALDREGHDTCRLSQTSDGWMLSGHAQFRDELGQAELNYIVRCSADWVTQSVDLTGQHGRNQVRAKLTQAGGAWQIGDVAQPEVKHAKDVDLSFTPATNLMPLRRLRDGGVSVQAAWLEYPSAVLKPLHQTYTPTGLPDVVHYSAEETGFTTELTVDRSGFVTLYPGLWEGEVTHAP